MEKIAIGSKVKPLGISRVNVAAGVKCRCVLVDPNPRMKYIAFDEERKRKVEVNQDLLLKYNLRASPTFYYLVAKLNTDMKGNVVSDEFVIEYLQLSENLNNEFSDTVAENPNFSSLVLSKVEKKGDGGKDFSYVKATPSNYVAPQQVLDKINAARANEQALEAMWALIDRATSITPDEYIRLREGTPDNESPAPAIAAAPQPRQIAQAPVAQPADDFGQSNDFGGGDDFGF